MNKRCLAPGLCIIICCCIIIVSLRRKVYIRYPDGPIFCAIELHADQMKAEYEKGRKRIERTGNPYLDYEWRWVWNMPKEPKKYTPGMTLKPGESCITEPVDADIHHVPAVLEENTK